MAKHAKFVAFTADGWTSRQQRSHVGITVHFITEEFQLLSFCLAAEHFEAEHTAQNLHDFYVRVFRNYDILDKIIGGTTDNGSNMVASMALEEKWIAIRCFIHTLQLAVKDALKV